MKMSLSTAMKAASIEYAQQQKQSQQRWALKVLVMKRQIQQEYCLRKAWSALSLQHHDGREGRRRKQHQNIWFSRHGLPPPPALPQQYHHRKMRMHPDPYLHERTTARIGPVYRQAVDPSLQHTPRNRNDAKGTGHTAQNLSHHHHHQQQQKKKCQELQRIIEAQTQVHRMKKGISFDGMNIVCVEEEKELHDKLLS